MRRIAFGFPLLLASLTGCVSISSEREQATRFAPPDTARCASNSLAIDTNFPAGAISACTIDEAGKVNIVIAPENEPPINCSPWYAFRVHTARPREVTVKLTYTACGHRYWPKISEDGTHWRKYSDNDFHLIYPPTEAGGVSTNASAEFTIDVSNAPVFVSAQEIVAPATYDAWLDGLEQSLAIDRSVLGKSAEGRDIDVIRFGATEAREQVVLVGRQHPPEVTGALAMFPFVETLLSDSDLARSFRERFEVTAVPLLNPDGVVRGYWRHNTGGVDLNRDWGPFTQPETQLMRGVLTEIERDPTRKLRVLLDFHSTNRDIFYTIPDELPTKPELFTSKWLERYQELMPGYQVRRDARHEVGRPISKAYTYDTFGVPGVTFEIGDETDRELVKRIGKQSAIALMETLLATSPDE